MPLTEINPIKAALELARNCKYQEAADLLYEEYEKDTHRFNLAQLANMLENGMTAEAIDGLQRLDGSIEEYKANPPADEPIGCTVQQHNQFPRGRW